MNRIYKWLLGSPVSRTAARKPQRSVLSVHQMEDRVVPSAVLYENAFEGAGATLGSGISAAWSGLSGNPDSTSYTPSQTPSGEGYLGGWKEYFADNKSTTLTLDGLAPGQAVTVSFDLYLIMTWDGNNPTWGGTSGSGDRWSLTANNESVIDTTFRIPRTWLPEQVGADYLQEYAPEGTVSQGTSQAGKPLYESGSGAVGLNTLGFKYTSSGQSYDLDNHYHFTKAVVADAYGMIELRFAGAGLQSRSDERWGLDNFIISADETSSTRVVITAADGSLVGDGGLKVAKWSGAFVDRATPNDPTVTYLAPYETDANTKQDFIDRDPDRFNVRVYDQGKWDNTVPYVDVTLETKNIAGFEAYDDAPTTIRLVRQTTPGKEGWYWSDSLILVSNTADDTQQKWLPSFGGEYTYEQLGADESGPGNDPSNIMKEGHNFYLTDRTHLIALGGTVNVKYSTTTDNGDDITYAATADAPVLMTAKINVNIFNRGDNPVISKAAATSIVSKANEFLAQAGVQLAITVQDPVAPPAGVDLDDGVSAPTQQEQQIYQERITNNPGHGSGDIIGPITPELSSIAKGTSSRTATTDDIELFFINSFAPAGTTALAYDSWHSSPEHQNNIFVSNLDPSAYLPEIIIAHEIIHVLSNGFHYNGPLSRVNIMTQFPNGVYDPDDLSLPNPLKEDQINITKRLTSQQATTILSWDDM